MSHEGTDHQKPEDVKEEYGEKQQCKLIVTREKDREAGAKRIGMRPDESITEGSRRQEIGRPGFKQA
ncbi:hypothetical protein PGTUg99_021292 [Puccinia graminis f. sp. tritici]|uniref:Uncharacterized protein n=1 Tax=Puccinia graminis f. sp. tritici TaxID=56615 RepID=A0A5B0Q1K6_PUCGR|nr:hypothetical protein PGTUg99_021292 [Puccinia graminis f. sp. tritici]